MLLRIIGLRSSFALGAAVALAALPAFGQYSRTPIPALGGAQNTVTSINTSGQATGCAETGMVDSKGVKINHAFLYTKGMMTDLGTLGGTNSCGNSINASGQITGYSDTGTIDVANPNVTVQHAFLFNNGVMTDLGTLGGITSSGNGINASGEVTGAADAAGPQRHAFLFSNGTMMDLGTLAPASDAMHPLMSSGASINTAGQVVGTSDLSQPTTSGEQYHAFLFSNGALTDLGTLPPIPPADLTQSHGASINDAGQVAGWTVDNQGTYGAFFSINGVLTRIANLPGFTNAMAEGINAGDQVVGTSWLRNASGFTTTQHPFLHSAGATTDLSTQAGFGDSLQLSAVAINDSGQIAVDGFSTSTAQTNAYILQPSKIAFIPAQLAFGNQTLGTPSAAQSVTLTNNSTSALSISGVTTTGPYAATSACGTSLAPAKSCTISVTFTPVAPDAAPGSLLVNSNGSDHAAVLSGVGTIAVTLTPSATSTTVNTPFTLTWKATSGAKCSASGGISATGSDSQWTGVVSASGSKSISESGIGTYTYVLSCSRRLSGDPSQSSGNDKCTGVRWRGCAGFSVAWRTTLAIKLPRVAEARKDASHSNETLGTPLQA